MNSVMKDRGNTLRGMRILTGSALLAWGAFAQSQARLEFEVASIKPAPPVGGGTGIGCQGGPGTADPGRLMCQQMSPALLIIIAYGVKRAQVAGPDWLASPRFEIAAKLPEGTTREQLATMWQNLLADRFHLRVHHEARELMHFDLLVAKSGSKLKPAPTGVASGLPRTGVIGRRADGNMHLDMPRLTVEGLASMLENQLHQPVTDATGLKGEYEIELQWTPDASTSTIESAPALPQALQEQLGLRLETKKGPVDMLVIDHIDRAPTQN